MGNSAPSRGNFILSSFNFIHRFSEIHRERKTRFLFKRRKRKHRERRKRRKETINYGLRSILMLNKEKELRTRQSLRCSEDRDCFWETGNDASMVALKLHSQRQWDDRCSNIRLRVSWSVYRFTLFLSDHRRIEVITTMTMMMILYHAQVILARYGRRFCRKYRERGDDSSTTKFVHVGVV